jgi:hypothetical protein
VSLVAIVVVAVVLTVAGRLVRLAVRVALLLALIALVVSYGPHAARPRRTAPRTPAIRRHPRR